MKLKFKLGEIVYYKSELNEPVKHPFLILGYKNNVLYGVKGTTDENHYPKDKSFILCDNFQDVCIGGGVKEKTFFSLNIEKENLEDVDYCPSGARQILSYDQYKATLKNIIANLAIFGDYKVDFSEIFKNSLNLNNYDDEIVDEEIN